MDIATFSTSAMCAIIASATRVCIRDIQLMLNVIQRPRGREQFFFQVAEVGRHLVDEEWKEISIPTNVRCPPTVSSANWIGPALSTAYTFQVEHHTAGKLRVKRTDVAANKWGEAWASSVHIEASLGSGCTGSGTIILDESA